MLKIDRKGKIIAGVVAFLLMTPLTVFYVLDGSGVFDTRSQAGEEDSIPEEYMKADLNADNKVSISDFSIWLNNFRQFKNNSTAYSSMSDLNDDGSISIADFSIWLGLWRGYKAYLNPTPEGGDGEAIDLFGSGTDGDVVITANTNLAVDTKIPNRYCTDGGDAVAYNVVGFESEGKVAVLSSTPSTGCLSVGDEVLLLNLQGTLSAYANVGNYETMKVESVQGERVFFSSAKAKFYGNNIDDDSNLGIADNTQRVVLQRVPNYKNLTINSGVTVTTSSWNGVKGGVLFVRVQGDMNINGSITVAGLGYRGGPGGAGPNMKHGGNGEGTNVMARVVGGNANIGGARGGLYNSFKGGGGGSYATQGKGAAAYLGQTYGIEDLSKMFLGSGGGGGASYADTSGAGNGGAGGRGGGIVYLAGGTVTVSGRVLANGGAGSAGVTHGAGGGGGAGGSVKIVGNSAILGTSLVKVSGGAGGNGYGSDGIGGTGGVGRISVSYFDSITGSTDPTFKSVYLGEQVD